MSGDFFQRQHAQIVERIAFVDATLMNYEVTVTDPTVFTRPSPRPPPPPPPPSTASRMREAVTR